jgi:NADPH:quinone reductase-like Zn-dependent oxidoreductase
VTGAEDFSDQVLALTGGKGANVILDAVGGPQFAKLVASAAEKAKILAYGALSYEPGTYPATGVVFKMLTIEGYNMADLLMDPVKAQAGIAFVKDGVQAGKLKPTVSKTFSLEDAVESHRYLDSNQHFGKVVLSVR